MSRIAAFVSYLVPVFGWIFVFLFCRKDEFAVFHTKQSIVLVLTMVIAPIVWLVAGWVVSFIPYVGFILTVSIFSLIVALYITLVFVWLLGMVYALQSKQRNLPLVGYWANRLPIG